MSDLRRALPSVSALLESAGVRVTERVPALVAPLESTEDYLRTKREKMGHLLEFDDL